MLVAVGVQRARAAGRRCCTASTVAKSSPRPCGAAVRIAATPATARTVGPGPQAVATGITDQTAVAIAGTPAGSVTPAAVAATTAAARRRSGGYATAATTAVLPADRAAAHTHTHGTAITAVAVNAGCVRRTTETAGRLR